MPFILRKKNLLVAIAALAVVHAQFLPCMAEEAPDQKAAAKGGVTYNSKILHVTTLEDSGKGSLRDAIKQCGPCIVIFDVSGDIQLVSDLVLDKKNITIAGETAPAPGITLRNGSVKIRGQSIVLSNLAVYPGSSPDPEIAGNRDGVSIYGSISKGIEVRDILLRNISIGWGVDENIGIQGLAKNIVIERSLIFQGLRRGGHPKGVHSMNILMAENVGPVTILGSVLAASEQRSPRMTSGNTVIFINNVMVDTGYVASHLDKSVAPTVRSTLIDMIGNVYIPGPDTKCRKTFVTIDKKMPLAEGIVKIFLKDNLALPYQDKECLSEPVIDKSLVSVSKNNNIDWDILPAEQVEGETLKYAGSWPSQRNNLDQYIVESIKNREIRIIGNESEMAIYDTNNELKKLKSQPPEALHFIKSPEDLNKIKSWLCSQYIKATGLKSCD